eukprot:6829896-Alexandrium_andersonii.AAC.1
MDDHAAAVQLAGGRNKTRPVQPPPLPADCLLPLGEGGWDVSCFCDGTGIRVNDPSRLIGWGVLG